MNRHGTAIIAALSMMIVSSQAANRWWDGTNSGGTGDGASDGGTATWNTSTLNWDQGNGSDRVSWTNANNDTAIFAGAAGTVSLGAGITIGGLQFDTASYIITNNILTWGAAGSIVANQDATINSVMAGSVAITKSGAGNLTLSAENTFSGQFLINDGAVTLPVDGRIDNGTASAVTIGALAGKEGVLNINGGSLSNNFNNARSFLVGNGAGKTGTVNMTSGFLTGYGLFLAEDAGGVATHNQSGGSTLFTSDSFMNGGSSTINLGGGSFTSTTLRMVAAASLTSSSSITITNTGSMTLTTLQIGLASRNFNTATVNLGNGVAGGTLQVNAITWNAGTGTNAFNFNGGTLIANGTFSSPSQLNTVVKIGGANISVVSGQAMTIPTALTDGGGGGGLTKSGLGTLTLSGTTPNTYAGNTVVDAGTLRLGAAGRIPDGTGKGDVTVNGTFDLNTFSETINGLSGTGRVDTIAGGSPTLTVGNDNDTATFSGTITDTAGALSLVKTGSGTQSIRMGSAASYAGSTTVNGGSLIITNTNDLGGISSSQFYINGASTLEFESSVGGANRTMLNNKTFTFGANGGGTINFNGGNHLFQGGNTHNIVTSGGAMNTISGSNGAFWNMQFSGIITFDVADGTDDTDLLYSAQWNNGFLSKSGAGKMQFSGSCVGDQWIGINAGTLEIGGSASLNGGTFTSTITNNGTFIYNSTAAQTLSGEISGTGGLIKTNTSTLTLSGANSYTGNTRIDGGTLIMNGSHGGGGLSYTVTAAGVLSGTGTISSAVTVDGVIAPGSGGIGTLTVGNASWAAGPAWPFELGAASSGDRLAINGGFTNNGGTGFTFDLQNTGVAGVYTLVTWTASTTFTNTDFSANNVPGGLTPAFTMNANSLMLELTSGGGGITAEATNSTIAVVGGQVAFGFTIASGALYHVQASTDLLAPVDNGFTNITGQLTNQQGGTIIYTNTTTDLLRMFRITSP